MEIGFSVYIKSKLSLDFGLMGHVRRQLLRVLLLVLLQVNNLLFLVLFVSLRKL
jgi:hypothetical protein